MPVVNCQHCGLRCRTEDGPTGNHTPDCEVRVTGAAIAPEDDGLRLTTHRIEIDLDGPLEAMRQILLDPGYSGVVIDSLSELQDSIVAEVSARVEHDFINGTGEAACPHCRSTDLRDSYGRGMVCDGCNRIQPQRCPEHGYITAGNPCPECVRAETQNGESASADGCDHDYHRIGGLSASMRCRRCGHIVAGVDTSDDGTLCSVRTTHPDGTIRQCGRLAYSGTMCRHHSGTCSHALWDSSEQLCRGCGQSGEGIQQSDRMWTCPRCQNGYPSAAACELHMETCQQLCAVRGCTSEREWGTDTCRLHTQQRMLADMQGTVDRYGVPIQSDASMARGRMELRRAALRPDRVVPPAPAPERAHLEALQRASGR